MSWGIIGGSVGSAVVGGVLGGIFGDEGESGANSASLQNDLLGQLDQYAGQAAGAANAGDRWLDAAYDPWQQTLQGGINPYTTSMIQSAQQDLIQDYANNALPRIRQSAQNAGGFGGSRQGVAEGIATEGLLESLGDVSVEMLNNAYNTNEANKLGALSLTPNMAQAALGPARVYTNLAQIYGNAGTGGQYQTGGSTMGNIAQGAALGSTYLPGIWDNIFNGNGGDNNASANAYGSLVTSNPSSFGWGQAFF